MTADPQQDEDRAVARVRARIATAQKWIGVWCRYVRLNDATAKLEEERGDEFGAALSRARGEVRAAAAELLRTVGDPLVAAQDMHRMVRRLRVRDLPLIGYDRAALDYTRARTWQNCARALDPSLPIVQPRLT